MSDETACDRLGHYSGLEMEKKREAQGIVGAGNREYDFFRLVLAIRFDTIILLSDMLDVRKRS